MAGTVPVPTCPMSATCKKMMEKPASRFCVVTPGIIFIILGLTIVVFLKILAWLVALALIVMGIAMLMMVNFMQDIGKRF